MLLFHLCLFFSASLPAQMAGIQPVDADTLHFYDEYQFRDFLVYHNLKQYSIKPQVDFYDCSVNPGTTIYTDQHEDDFLHEERFIGKPLVFIVDHNGTRKIYHILIPSTGDTTITTCDVQLTLTNPVTGQVVVFDDIYNWIDENGRNIFNMNKKMYFLWGFDSGNVDFPAEMLQLPTGIDFTFPDYFPEDGGPINLIMTNIDMYTQYTYYFDADGDGYGDSAIDTMDYAAPPGFVENADDCDDTNAAAFPGAAEILNGIDDDCNGSIDEGISMLFFVDADDDGYGNDLETVLLSELLPGYTLIGGDCNDIDPLIHPAATEICNGLDDDCDGITDEDLINPVTTPSGSVSMCAGSVMTISVPDEEDYNYIWRKNGIELAGEVNAELNVTGSGNYSVNISLDGGCSAISSDVYVTVNSQPNPVITVVTDLDLCTEPGIGTAKLRTSAPTGATIQWLKDGVVIPGISTKTRTFNTPGTYQSKVTNVAGCTATSAGVTIFSSCREASMPNAEPGMLLLPNPANNYFVVQANLNESYTNEVYLQIYSLDGRCVYTKQMDMSNNNQVYEQVAVQTLGSASVYIVKLHTGYTTYTQLLMVNQE
jgi:hypothetical protein